MRCFYCGHPRNEASTEHIPSAFLGSRLKTRKVCLPCNRRAGIEIDDPLAAYLMVSMPRALADVRNVRRQQKQPVVEVDGVVSTTGEPTRIRFSPSGREAVRDDGTPVNELVEVSYPMDSDLWVRFIAKVALGCATQLCDDQWIDGRLAAGLRSLMWHESIDPALWPGGVSGWPDELDVDHPVRVALGDDRHLIGVSAADDAPDSSVALAMLFGGQITCRLPLPGLAVSGSGPVWIVDWHPGEPPSAEDFDQAIERLLRERGWSEARINSARMT